MAKKPPPVKKPSRVSVPDHAHPLAKLLYAEMQRQGVTYNDLEWKSGVHIQTFKAWRSANTPGLSSMEACLGVVGWGLVPVPRFEDVPAEVRVLLKQAAALWKDENRVLYELLGTVCTAPILIPGGAGDVVVATIKPRVPRRRREHPDQGRIFEDMAA